jgi:hypothetical protein
MVFRRAGFTPSATVTAKGTGIVATSLSSQKLMGSGGVTIKPGSSETVTVAEPEPVTIVLVQPTAVATNSRSKNPMVSLGQL